MLGQGGAGGGHSRKRKLQTAYEKAQWVRSQPEPKAEVFRRLFQSPSLSICKEGVFQNKLPDYNDYEI